MLPFTAEILFSSFEQYNRALWPLPVLAPVLALAVLLLAWRPVRGAGRASAALLAAAWCWLGVGYFYLHFATIDFAAPVYAACFLLEGLLLAWTGVVRGKLACRMRADLFGRLGLALALAALAAYPVADGLTGHGWASVRLVGLTPGPTTAFTLGLLLTERRPPLHLAVIPLFWSLVAGARGWLLDIPQDLALPATAVVAFGLILWRKRRS